MRTGSVKWSPKKRSSAIVLRGEGYTYEEIAKKLGGGATRSGVYRVCNKFSTYRTIKDLSGRGRKKKTTAQDDRRIVRISLQNRNMPSNEIQGIMNSSGVTVSSRTVRRRLFQNKLCARRPRKKPYLNATQRSKRLAWAKAHRNWTVEKWSTILFSDESQISLFGHNGVQYVRRRAGEEMLPICIKATMKHPTSVMVWACMGRGGVGRLQVINGTVNAEKYVTEILSRKLLQSASDVFGPDITNRRQFVFQQDSAPCHVAKRSMQWLKNEGVEVLDWPGNSPDLNPIENLWSRLKRIVGAKKPSNRTELIEAILNAWFRVITPEQLEQLVDSMPRRCEAVIKAKGYPTKY